LTKVTFLATQTVMYPGDEYAIAVIAVVIFVGVFGNIFVIITFKKNKTLRNPVSLTVANLAIVDTLQLFMAIYFNLFIKDEPGNKCKTNAYLIFTFAVISSWTLLLISVNRYIMICRPKFKHIANRKYNCRYHFLLDMGCHNSSPSTIWVVRVRVQFKSLHVYCLGDRSDVHSQFYIYCSIDTVLRYQFQLLSRVSFYSQQA